MKPQTVFLSPASCYYCPRLEQGSAAQITLFKLWLGTGKIKPIVKSLFLNVYNRTDFFYFGPNGPNGGFEAILRLLIQNVFFASSSNTGMECVDKANTANKKLVQGK